MGELSFRELRRGSGSSSTIKRRGSIVIVDSVVLKDVWNNLDQRYNGRGELVSDEPPHVNFDNETVLVVLRGEFTAGGYGIEVMRVIEEDSRILVQAKGTGGIGMTTVMSYPYQIIAIATPPGLKPLEVELVR